MLLLYEDSVASEFGSTSVDPFSFIKLNSAIREVPFKLLLLLNPVDSDDESGNIWRDIYTELLQSGSN